MTRGRHVEGFLYLAHPVGWAGTIRTGAAPRGQSKLLHRMVSLPASDASYRARSRSRVVSVGQFVSHSGLGPVRPLESRGPTAKLLRRVSFYAFKYSACVGRSQRRRVFLTGDMRVAFFAGGGILEIVA